MNITNFDDPFYRYKRPKFDIQLLKNKTHIFNLNAIADALKREPKLLEKYFGKCCSTSCGFNKQKIFEINTLVTMEKLDMYLQAFIDKYVLCQSCKNPETVISKEGNMIGMKCKACGMAHKTEVKNSYDKLVYNNTI